MLWGLFLSKASAVCRNQPRKKCLVTLAVNDKISKSMLLIDEEGYLCGKQFEGKREIYITPKGNIKPIGFCGYHIISPKIFSTKISLIYFSIIDLYLKLLKLGIPISTWHIQNSYWIDIGTPEDLKKANQLFPGLPKACHK